MDDNINIMKETREFKLLCKMNYKLYMPKQEPIELFQIGEVYTLRKGRNYNDIYFAYKNTFIGIKPFLINEIFYSQATSTRKIKIKKLLQQDDNRNI
jgi:hypothetical protein